MVITGVEHPRCISSQALRLVCRYHIKLTHFFPARPKTLASPSPSPSPAIDRSLRHCRRHRPKKLRFGTQSYLSPLFINCFLHFFLPFPLRSLLVLKSHVLYSSRPVPSLIYLHFHYILYLFHC